MISAIRNKFGSRLLDFFIWMSIFIFVGLYLIPGGQNGQKSAEWAISVNNETLPYQEYLLVLENQRKMGGKLEESHKKEVIEALTIMLLMQSLENKMNLLIKPEVIRAKLQKALPGLVNSDGSIDIEQLKAKMGQEGFGKAELESLASNLQLVEKQITQELKNEVLNNVLVGSLYLPQFALNNYYNSEYALKQYAILKASYEKYHHEVNKHKIEDGVLKAFFDQQNIASKKYWTTELRSGVIWSFKPDSFDIKITDKQIKSYYDRNRKDEFVKQAPKIQVRRILVANQDQAGLIRAELANDASRFEELAKAHSIDKQSAGKGGLLDFFGENELDKNLSAAAFELRADGEISEVIETSSGFEIIQRVTKSKIEFKPLEEVSADIAKKLSLQQFEKLFPINARRIIAESVKNPQALAQFATSKKASQRSVSRVSNSFTDHQISKLYELKKVDQKAFLINAKHGEIIVLTGIEPAQVQDFEKIKHTVLIDYHKAMTIKAIEKQLDAAKEALKSGKAAKQVAHELGLEYEHTPFVSKEHASALKKDAPLNLLWSLRTAGAVRSAIVEQAGHSNGYVAKLEQIKQPAPDDLAAKKSETKLQLFSKYRTSLDGSFIASLRKNGTIKVNTAIINV